MWYKKEVKQIHIFVKKWTDMMNSLGQNSKKCMVSRYFVFIEQITTGINSLVNIDFYGCFTKSKNSLKPTWN